jgi:hypothetical protein
MILIVLSDFLILSQSSGRVETFNGYYSSKIGLKCCSFGLFTH